MTHGSFGRTGVRAVLFLLIAALLIPLGGCGAPSHDGDFRVVCTVFPLYDWTRTLAASAEGVSVELLLDNGIDMHSFQPSVAQIASIGTCDLFVYIGGESDAWVEDVLKNAPDVKTLRLTEAVAPLLRPEETLEGMQDDGEEEGPLPDEHLWLSPAVARAACAAIAQALTAACPDASEAVAASASAYDEKLAALDAAWADTVSSAARRTAVICDRFPFLYLFRDYGIDGYAAFSGCSADSDASFSTVTFLADRVREASLPCVLMTESGDETLAATVLDCAGMPDLAVLTLDSLQSVTAAEIGAGLTYLDVMEANRAVMETALN